MLIFSELFLAVYFDHFELKNGVMMTPKRRSILLLIVSIHFKNKKRFHLLTFRASQRRRWHNYFCRELDGQSVKKLKHSFKKLVTNICITIYMPTPNIYTDVLIWTTGHQLMHPV